MPVPRWASVYLHQDQGEAPVRLDSHGWAWPLLCVRCSLVIDEIPEVPIVVAVRVELESDDTVTVGVDHREDRLRARIERELLVGVGAVTVRAGAHWRVGVRWSGAKHDDEHRARHGDDEGGDDAHRVHSDSFLRARFVALTSDCGAILPLAQPKRQGPSTPCLVRPPTWIPGRGQERPESPRSRTVRICREAAPNASAALRRGRSAPPIAQRGSERCLRRFGIVGR